MSDNIFSEKRSRYYLPEPTNVLFASYFDDYHIRSLSTSIHEVLEYVLGSRQVGYLQPEVRLLTRVCYYLPALLAYQATPGHAFSALRPALYEEEEDNQRKGIRFPDLQRLLYLSLSYSVLPYLYERRDHIYRHMMDLYKIITAIEVDLIENPEEPVGSTEHEENALDEGYVSFWAVFKRALVSCYMQHIGVDNTTRLTRICNFLYDWHVMLFLVYHR
ncbi:hypothetical protein EON65_42275 [archaeon]|nr:MAG: hypothetical protein EON65_42275 [archaeon]